MQNSTHLRITFAVELLLLAASFPILYFPRFFPSWALGCGFILLVAGWGWRRWRLGFWRVTTPIDWPLLILFCVLLPMSVWAAPEVLRQQYSWPRAYILVWNFCLFWVVVVYSSLHWEFFRLCIIGFMGAGTAIALAAPLGTNWLYKFALLDPILRRIPSPLIGVFNGADSGFHPNQVAGTLLYVLPLMIALTVGLFFQQRQRTLSTWMLLVATGIVLLVFFTTQSRGGFLGLAVGVLVMGLLPSKSGRWVLTGIGLVTVGIMFILPGSILKIVSDAPPVEAIGGIGTLGFRQEVWGAALQGMQDFPFTGMGLGTFRQIARLLYPVSIDPNYDIGHAHNVFLQSALDFGLPGMIALLAIYMITFTQIYSYYSTTNSLANEKTLTVFKNKVLILGLGTSLLAQMVYSQLDTVAMGSKTNFLFWYLLATCVIYATIGRTTFHRHQ